jgi:putative flippase GtrA
MTSPNTQFAAFPEIPLAAAAGAGHSALRFIRFLAAGGFAAFVNLASRYLLTPVIGFKLSIVAAYLLGMLVAFILFRTLVFGRSGATIAVESYRFVIVNMVALTLVWGISVTLVSLVFPAIRLSWHAEDIAHFIGVSVPAITSYIGHSMYTFRMK